MQLCEKSQNCGIKSRNNLFLFFIQWRKISPRVGLNEMLIHSLPLGAAGSVGRNSGFPGNAVHKAASLSQTLLYQALKIRPIGPITAISVTLGKNVGFEQVR